MHEPALNALCPRCGYDQRGITATWRESCPLEARCTECGLLYCCAEVLRPEKFEPRWCVEYCPRSAGAFLRSSGGTLARSFLPWRFWSHLQMSHRIQPKRIAPYLAVLLLPMAILYVAIQTTAALYARSLMHEDFVWQTTWAQTLAAQPVLVTDEDFEERIIRDRGEEWVLGLQEDRPDEWRYMVENARIAHERQHAWATRILNDPPQIEGSAALAVMEAVLLPLARKSALTVSSSPFTDGSYPAPYDIWKIIIAESVAMRGTFGWRSTGHWLESVQYAISVMAFGLLVALLFPLSLALLPMSRRKAKVRWAHIARITAYGMFVPIVAVAFAALVIAVDGVRLWRTGVVGDYLWLLLFVAIGFIPLGTMLWWLFAINRHLKMPHALAITALLMFVCFLAALAIVYHLLPHTLFGDAV